MGHLRATDLADHEAVGTHAQGLAHEVGQRHATDAVGSRLHDAEGHGVRTRTSQFGGVLEHDHAVLADLGQQTRQQGGPAGPGAARDDEVAPGGEDVDCSNEPLYPFGHGLTYGHVELEPVPADPVDRIPTVAVGEVVDVPVVVANVGDRRADEVVQLYSRDPVATIARPVLELQGFTRVTLDPGERRRVTFHLQVDTLGFNGPDLAHVLEPGEVELLVGTSAAEVEVVRRVAIAGDDLVAATRPLARDVTVGPA